jgi:hypothetical protein
MKARLSLDWSLRDLLEKNNIALEGAIRSR